VTVDREPSGCSTTERLDDDRFGVIQP